MHSEFQMKMNKSLYSRVILLFVLQYVLLPGYSAGQQTISRETVGIDFFRQGNFEKALPVFAKLAQSYPDNAMYNYYYGVCLIKNNIFETAAKEALLNSVVDKTPADANFYLGNYFHALEEWQEAMDFYDRFSKAGNKAEKRSVDFERYLSLCKQKINPFKPRKAKDTALFGDGTLKPPKPIDEKNFPIPEDLKKATFNFQVNEVLAYHNISDFKSEASKILFTKAWICTGKNDSLVTLTDTLRKQHDRIARVETRLGLVQQIVDCEQKSFQLMRDREKFLEQSRAKESAWWEREGNKAAQDYNQAIQEREKRLSEAKKPVTRQEPEEKKILVKKDTAAVAAPANTPTSQPAAKTRTVENLVFKVQIGSFKNGVLTPTFKNAYLKISKLRKVDKFTDPKKYVVYTVGSFTRYEDATRLKEQLILEGMKGSFVVSYHKGIKIPVTEALKLANGK